MDKQTIISLAIELLKEGKTTKIVANGISMFPLLHPGDILTIQPTQEITIGDIVVFKAETSLIAHRVVKIFDNKIYCKGDSLFSVDKPFLLNETLGKVIERQRDGKTIKNTSLSHRLFAKIIPYTGKYPSLLFRWWAILWLKLRK